MKNINLGQTIRILANTGVIAAILMPTPAIQQELYRTQAWVTESSCPDNTPAVFHECALEAAKAFDPPRTSDGQPDMGGIWQLPGAANEDLEEHPEALDDTGGPTSIVDPLDGKIPMRSWAAARRRENAQENIHPSAACLLSGMPYTMYRPGPYQFLQTPDYFVVLSTRAHAYRVVPLEDLSPVGDNLRLWNGVSRGRWEGNTLVIETTNQNAMTWLDQRAKFYTKDAQVVERLTLIDTDTIHYQATVTDPDVYTSPFTIALAYRRNAVEGFEMLVEACYENNESLLEIYRAAGFTLYPGISVEEAQEAMEAAGPGP